MAALIRLQSLSVGLRPTLATRSYSLRPRAALIAPRSASVAFFSSKTKQKFIPRADPNAAKFEERFVKPKPQEPATPPPAPKPTPAPAAPEATAASSPAAPAQPAVTHTASAASNPSEKPATFTSIYEEQTRVKVTPPPELAPVPPAPKPIYAQERARSGGSGGSSSGGFSDPLDPAAEAKRRIRNALVLSVVSVFVAFFYKLVRNVAMTQDVDEDEEIPSESILQSVAPTDEARQMVRFARYQTVRIVVPKENQDVEPKLNVDTVAAHLFREMPSHAKFTTFLGCDNSVATLPDFGQFPVGMKLGPLTIVDRTPTAILFSRKDATVGDISIVLDVKKALVTEHSSIFLACLGTVIQNPQPLPTTILSGSARLDTALSRLYLKRGTMALRSELGILKDPFYKDPVNKMSPPGATAPAATETALVHPLSQAPGQAGITAASK